MVNLQSKASCKSASNDTYALFEPRRNDGHSEVRQIRWRTPRPLCRRGWFERCDFITLSLSTSRTPEATN